MSSDDLAVNDIAGAIERRATVRLKHYWRSLRRFGVAPAFRDFDPQRNPVPWDQCFLVSAGPSAETPSVEHVGRALWLGGRPPVAAATVGPALPPALPEHLVPLVADLAAAFATGQPVERSGSHALAAAETLLYRSILLPFVDLDRQPRYGLVAVTSHRRLRPAGG